MIDLGESSRETDSAAVSLKIAFRHVHDRDLSPQYRL